MQQTDTNGDYQFGDLPNSGTYLLAATGDRLTDFSEKITLADGQNIKNIELSSTGEYTNSADSEYIVTISEPETGYAHIQCLYKHMLPYETVKLDMHYVYDDFLTIENIRARDNKGNILPASLARIVKQDGFIWYELTVENSDSTEMVLEYDIHYVTICHDGNPECYHAYLCDSYGVFENMNHILFAGASGFNMNGETTAIRFNLPEGWVAVTPWEKIGNYFVGKSDDMIYAAPGVGRFELHRLPVNETTVVLGIHEDANNYAPLPEQWPITKDSFLKGINAAHQINTFESDRSIIVGIPPLGPNEGAINSVYSPADNFPASFWNLGGMEDIRWCESRWTYFILEYFGDLILYTSGVNSNGQYRRLIDEYKDTYSIQVYGTPGDIPVADFEQMSGGDKDSTAEKIKTILFVYLLDFEIRVVSGDSKTISDAVLYWRNNLNLLDWSNADALTLLNELTGSDFSDFFNKYFFGNEKLPVEVDWYYSSSHPSANAGQDQSVNEGQNVQLDASGSYDPNGDIVSYSWKQINGPEVDLENDTSITPTFLSPEITDPGTPSVQVDFELTVRYFGHLWDSDDVSIFVNKAPADDQSDSDDGSGDSGGGSGGGGGCYISDAISSIDANKRKYK